MPVLKHTILTPDIQLQKSILSAEKVEKYDRAIIARKLGEAAAEFIEYESGKHQDTHRLEGSLVVMKPSDFKRLRKCIRGALGSWSPDTVRHYALKALDILNQI